MLKKVTIDHNDFKKIFRLDTPSYRFIRTIRRILKAAVSLVILFLIFFFGFNYQAFYQRFHYSVTTQPTSPAPIVQPIAPPQPTISYKPELIIDKISVDAPLIMNVADDLVIDNLKNGVVQYADTAEPGQNGNLVIIGHSSDYPWSNGHYKTIFALLDKLKVGDTVTIPYGSQKFVYEVTGSRVVAPTELSVLRKTTEPTLTLLTCYPVGTTRNRLIITAKLVQGQVTGTQVSQPAIANLPQPR